MQITQLTHKQTSKEKPRNRNTINFVFEVFFDVSERILFGLCPLHVENYEYVWPRVDWSHETLRSANIVMYEKSIRHTLDLIHTYMYVFVFT